MLVWMKEKKNPACCCEEVNQHNHHGNSSKKKKESKAAAPNDPTSEYLFEGNEIDGIFTPVCVAALFTIARERKTNSSSTDEWTKKSYTVNPMQPSKGRKYHLLWKAQQ